jgi:uncharacterized protein YukE
MRAFYRFVSVLAVVAALFAPTAARAAELETDCSSLAKSAAHLDQIAGEIHQTMQRAGQTGSELAAHTRGQAGTALQSSLQRFDMNAQSAMRAMHDTLESVHASCSQYRPADEMRMPMNMKRMGSEQAWNFSQIESANGALQHSYNTLDALAAQWNSVQGDFGGGFRSTHQRSSALLREAVQSLAQLSAAAAQAASAMQETEKATGGMFNKSAPRPTPSAHP